MLINLLTFYLFDDIEKKSKSLMRIILQRQKMLVQPERLYFLFAFCARDYPSGCPPVREKSGKFVFSSRSGKKEFCKIVREIRKSSKVREKSGNFKIMFG